MSKTLIDEWYNNFAKVHGLKKIIDNSLNSQWIKSSLGNTRKPLEKVKLALDLRVIIFQKGSHILQCSGDQTKVQT